MTRKKSKNPNRDQVTVEFRFDEYTKSSLKEMNDRYFISEKDLVLISLWSLEERRGIDISFSTDLRNGIDLRKKGTNRMQVTMSKYLRETMLLITKMTGLDDNQIGTMAVQRLVQKYKKGNTNIFDTIHIHD